MEVCPVPYALEATKDVRVNVAAKFQSAVKPFSIAVIVTGIIEGVVSPRLERVWKSPVAIFAQTNHVSGHQYSGDFFVEDCNGFGIDESIRLQNSWVTLNGKCWGE